MRATSPAVIEEFRASTIRFDGPDAQSQPAVGETDCGFTVNSSPNAVSAYERLGFRITGSEQCVHGIRFVPMQRLSSNDRNA